MTPILLRTMFGLGDSIYQRAVVRELTADHDVYLETPWPQLYSDLPIKCVKRPTTLRTQARNANRPDIGYVSPPALRAQRLHYVGRPGTMLDGLCAALGINPARITFDLPAFHQSPRTRPYVVVRPATVRTEWMAPTRNPLPEYLADAAAAAAGAGFEVISVADLAPGVEWAIEPLPPADVTYHRGELRVEELLALIAGAAGVIGGVGWIVPAACAYRVPLLLFYGGTAVHDGPARIFDPRMPSENVTHAIPDNFCYCTNHRPRHHVCDKRITDADAIIGRWVMERAATARVAMAS